MRDLLGRAFRANPRVRAGTVGPARARGAPRPGTAAGRSGLLRHPAPAGTRPPGSASSRSTARPPSSSSPCASRARCPAYVRAVLGEAAGADDGAAGGGRHPGDRGGRRVRLRRRGLRGAREGREWGRRPARRGFPSRPSGTARRWRSTIPSGSPCRLYGYNRRPLTPRWQRLLPSPRPCGTIWGSAPGAPTAGCSTAPGTRAPLPRTG